MVKTLDDLIITELKQEKTSELNSNDSEITEIVIENGINLDLIKRKIILKDKINKNVWSNQEDSLLLALVLKFKEDWA